MDYLALLLTKYGYFILFPLAAIEGPIVSLVVGFLIYLGYFQFLPAYALLILGDLIPDTAYYYLGRFGNKEKLIEKYGARYDFISGNFKLVEKLWQKHGRKTMFLGKLAYGLSVPFLISAGLIKMPFRKFISYTFPVTLFQYGVLMTIGYALGNSYQIAEQYIQDVYVIIAAILILFVVCYIFLMKYARGQIEKMEQEE
jgi:membrane protein DedA with SNARE-associated domain